MMYRFLGHSLWIIVGALWLALLVCPGCANITSPTGGKKDTTAPKLLSVEPANNSLNIRPKRIELRFDEYITVTDVSKEVQLSPMLAIDPTVVGLNKKVTVKIADTLLEPNTTYRLTFGNSIKDLHEGNVFKKYTYTFSTGSYFDSLQLTGKVLVAATGLPDTGGVVVELYYATENDSAVVRHKPKYITKTIAGGLFTFKGLPKKIFRIYALKDANDNLVYDGNTEMIAFNNTNVTPGDTTMGAIELRLFREPADTSIKKVDTLANRVAKKPVEVKLAYTTNIDTSNAGKRTFDMNNKIKLTFNTQFVLNKDKITLAYDSMGTPVSVPIKILTDTAHPSIVQIQNEWIENTAYTLRLPKGFAKDTGGAEAAPSRYKFRTWQEEDYGTIRMHLPSKYHKDNTYIFQVTCENDTIYQKPVTDTQIILRRLKPAKYSFRIIVDKNHNGKWDAGDLFGKIQPEVVIPYREPVTLKAGFELDQDFEPKPEPKKTAPGKK